MFLNKYIKESEKKNNYLDNVIKLKIDILILMKKYEDVMKEIKELE